MVMELSEIKRRMRNALVRLNKCDYTLMLDDVSERCIVHQFANKLAYEFRSYDVDCEYNGNSMSANQNKKKSIQNVNHRLITLGHARGDFNVPMNMIVDMPVFPDLIIHKRRSNASNLLIIEVKKSGSDRHEVNLDKEKLKIYTQRQSDYSFCEFDYQFGLLLIVGCASRYPNHKLIWYENGVMEPEQSFSF